MKKTFHRFHPNRVKYHPSYKGALKAIKPIFTTLKKREIRRSHRRGLCWKTQRANGLISEAIALSDYTTISAGEAGKRMADVLNSFAKEK